MKKVKIGVNENLTSLFTYISSNPKYIMWSDILQFAIDYDLYVEFYVNLSILEKLIIEHNQMIVAKRNKESK